MAVPTGPREAAISNGLGKGLGKTSPTDLHSFSAASPQTRERVGRAGRKLVGNASSPKRHGRSAKLDRLRPGARAIELEGGPGATEQREPEAADDETVEVASPGSNVPLTPLTSEQERHLSVAAKALDRL